MNPESQTAEPTGQTPGTPANPWISRTIVCSVLVTWAGLSALAANMGFYQSLNGAPPYGLVAAALLPPALFWFAHLVSSGLQNWVRNLDLGLIIALQAWRVVGAAFVFVWGLGMLPAGFAVPAGFGDIAVGILAPFVALAVWKQSRSWRVASYLLIIAGLSDFVIAFATGAMARDGGAIHRAGTIHTGLLAELPLSLIPGFLVPVFAILHLIALIKLKNSHASGWSSAS